MQTICTLLEESYPHTDFHKLITHIDDRPGHDRRYAINAMKIERELNWRPGETFATGIRKTIHWYLNNQQWVADVQTGAYQEWINKNYAGLS